MSTPSDIPQEPFTAEQIATWIVSAERKLIDLQLVFAEPFSNTFRELAFVRMSALVKEAIEEVRVVSANLQHNSQELRTHAQRLREQSTTLGERSRRAHEPRAQDTPSPEEKREAE